MKQREVLWCLLQMQLDEEEKLENLCPTCREKAMEARCTACGQTTPNWAEGGVNAGFDESIFQQRKEAGA